MSQSDHTFYRPTVSRGYLMGRAAVRSIPSIEPTNTSPLPMSSIARTTGFSWAQATCKKAWTFLRSIRMCSKCGFWVSRHGNNAVTLASSTQYKMTLGVSRPLSGTGQDTFYRTDSASRLIPVSGECPTTTGLAATEGMWDTTRKDVESKPLPNSTPIWDTERPSCQPPTFPTVETLSTSTANQTNQRLVSLSLSYPTMSLTTPSSESSKKRSSKGRGKTVAPASKKTAKTSVKKPSKKRGGKT